MIWMAAVMLLIFGACSSDSSEEQTPVLNIYVYAPGQPTPTRSVIDPTPEEKKIHSMTIWVYKSSDGSQLGSITLDENVDEDKKELETLNNDNMGIYSMAVDEKFAKNPEPVDVYVLANVTASNTGMSFDATIDKWDLENNAKFNGGYYYPFVKQNENRAATALSKEGLPMSGVVREKAVINQNAVLHMTDANLQLVRDISKIRFVFSAIDDSYLYIDEVKLNKNLLYTSDYLFLNDEHPYFRVGTSLVNKEIVLFEKKNGAPQYVNTCADPRVYAYVSGMDETAYDAKIKDGLAKGELTEAPTVYLPESDKRLTGTVTFHFSSNPSDLRTANFTMLNGDFRRNQTWIVYIYYNGSSKLDITSVKVTDWEDGGETDHDLHNW